MARLVFYLIWVKWYFVGGGMSKRQGASLIETIVVIAIVGTLLALLLPAIQAARQRALDVQCQNNLRQINLAIADFAETHKRLPGPAPKGMVGGWAIEILPFLEQKNLADQIAPGTPILAAPDYLLRLPLIFRCPMRGVNSEPSSTTMDAANYIFVPNDRRKSYHVFDAPASVTFPWAGGPEMTYSAIAGQVGPHNRGLFFASGFQGGVGYLLDGQVVR